MLSGGNKRKLSVAMAMIGNPKIVFLDEPSTGMDPVARRFMWDVISRIVNRDRSCAVVLTTHSMEEADMLGDRIAVMSHGKIQAIGTSLFLKNKYGGGFKLSLFARDPETGGPLPERESAAKAAGIESWLTERVPGITLISNVEGCLQFQVPTAGTCCLWLALLSCDP